MNEPLTNENNLARMKADAQMRIAVRPSIVSPPPYVTAEELLTLIECAEALRSVTAIAEEARDHWDNDRDMKVGKILIALSGRVSRYRPDIDKIHEAISKLEALCQST